MRTSNPVIDLNADVGESFARWNLGNDASLIPQLTSANVACGFHAGDARTMRVSCELAASSGVKIGAHPSYRDLAGFGRRFLDVEPSELRDEVMYQLGALQAIAKSAGTAVNYVKPHGALYNAIVSNESQAQAVVDAVKGVDDSLPLLVLPNSAIEQLGLAAGLRIFTEAFADRAYTPEGTLVPRGTPGALLTEEKDVIKQCLQIAVEGTVTAIDGSTVSVNASSICLHGDTPGAAEFAAALRKALTAAGVELSAFS